MFLFLLILFINLLFWLSWFKLTFNNISRKIENFVRRVLGLKMKRRSTVGMDDLSIINLEELGAKPREGIID